MSFGRALVIVTNNNETATKVKPDHIQTTLKCILIHKKDEQN